MSSKRCCPDQAIKRYRELRFGSLPDEDSSSDYDPAALSDEPDEYDSESTVSSSNSAASSEERLYQPIQLEHYDFFWTDFTASYIMWAICLVALVAAIGDLAHTKLASLNTDSFHYISNETPLKAQFISNFEVGHQIVPELADAASDFILVPYAFDKVIRSTLYTLSLYVSMATFCWDSKYFGQERCHQFSFEGRSVMQQPLEFMNQRIEEWDARKRLDFAISLNRTLHSLPTSFSTLIKDWSQIIDHSESINFGNLQQNKDPSLARVAFFRSNKAPEYFDSTVEYQIAKRLHLYINHHLHVSADFLMSMADFFSVLSDLQAATHTLFENTTSYDPKLALGLRKAIYRLMIATGLSEAPRQKESDNQGNPVVTVVKDLWNAIIGKNGATESPVLGLETLLDDYTHSTGKFLRILLLWHTHLRAIKSQLVASVPIPLRKDLESQLKGVPVNYTFLFRDDAWYYFEKRMGYRPFDWVPDRIFSKLYKPEDGNLAQPQRLQEFRDMLQDLKAPIEDHIRRWSNKYISSCDQLRKLGILFGSDPCPERSLA